MIYETNFGIEKCKKHTPKINIVFLASETDCIFSTKIKKYPTKKQVFDHILKCENVKCINHKRTKFCNDRIS